MPIPNNVPKAIADTIRGSGLEHLPWVAKDGDRAVVDFGEGRHVLAYQNRFCVLTACGVVKDTRPGPGARMRIARTFADHAKRYSEDGTRLTAGVRLAAAASMMRKPPSEQKNRIIAAATAAGYPSINALARALGVSGSWLLHVMDRPIWPYGRPSPPKRGRPRAAATLESIATLLGVTPESIAPDESETP